LTPEQQAALLLRLELISVQDAYIATLDEGRLEDWPSMFTEDCLYEIIPRENVDAGLPAPLIRCEGAAMLRDRVISLRHANIYETPHYRHMLSGHSVTLLDDATVAMRASYVVINTSQDGDSTIFQAGYYQDRLVRTDDGWRFSVKRAVYDTHRVQTLLAYPV
jgi:anthranilate 1,2-dioxygenase small subunit